MPKNDWNQLGNDIKNIVQDAIETGDYGRLNRDLGVTLENALGNMATSVKDAAIKNLNHFSGSQQTANQRRTVSPERQRQEQNMRGYKKKLVKEAREKFALYVNTSSTWNFIYDTWNCTCGNVWSDGCNAWDCRNLY